ncbi:hypothetical protein IV203_035857 [Nitzschia inconspicua]|uniref:Uncharacterized protein n=1 Tax=Nitzschia inconspicua TaxID=303405 RepID=A0A9K3LEZ7_9STRA|nr:hypothetical protein IV203_035857 [Nitzschia inconspicua]
MASKPRNTEQGAAEAEAAEVKQGTKPPPSLAIDTSSVNLDDNDDRVDNDGPILSNTFMTCLLFIVHMATNSILLSAWNPTRCLFWNLAVCPPDLGWITTFLSLGHLQVVILLSSLARSVYGDPLEEVKFAHLVSSILCLEIAIGMFSKPDLHRPFLVIQLLVWTVLLACLQWFTYFEYDELLRIQQRATRFGGATPTPRELFLAVSRMQNTSTRSLGSVPGTPGRRSWFTTPTNSYNSNRLRVRGYPILSLSLGIVIIGSFVQLMELILDEGKTSYYAGASGSISAASNSYQNSADMVTMDKWMVIIILAASLRFFNTSSQRAVLMGQIAGLMLHLIVLTAGPGELMEVEAMRATGIGTFFMILTAILGVL